MSFAYTVAGREWVSRRKRMTWGTFTNGATDTGGAIVTGMKIADHVTFSINSHVGATMPKATISGGTVTIVTDDGVSGTWRASGT
jgi:hypothetical protein